MLKFFHSNRTSVLALIPLILATFFMLNYFTNYHQIEGQLKLGLWGRYPIENSIVFSIPAVLLVGIGAIVMNNLFNRNDFAEKNNFLPSLLYIVFSSFFYFNYFIDGAGIAHFFLILMLRQLFRLRQKEDGRRLVFNAAFFFGIACTFFPFLILALPFLYFMIWICRPFIFRESALALTGFLVPLVYALLFMYMMDIEISLLSFTSSSKDLHKLDLIIAFVATGLFSLLALKPLLHKFQVSSIRLKKIFRLIILLTILFVGIALIDAVLYQKMQVVSWLIIPLVLIIPQAFGEKKVLITPSIVFYLLFIFSVSKFFIPFESFVL